MKHITTDQGVQINTDRIKPNNVVEITYKGLLAQSGADEVYLHCGSSETREWNDIQDIRMTKLSPDLFKAHALVQDGTVFNICFRDSAQNWDNNSGSNYSFTITE
ncbi:MAG: carbohydrate-binding protein [Bacillota bacterium]